MPKATQSDSYHLRLPKPVSQKVHKAAKDEGRTFHNMLLRLVDLGLADFERRQQEMNHAERV